jgi:CRISPR-associated protein Cas1
MFTIENTLYVMTPNAYVHIDNMTLRIDVDHEKRLQVPLHHVGGLVAFGNVMLSTPLMHRLAEEGKSLVLLDESGRFKARLEGPVSGNVLLRQAQHVKSRDPGFALEMARALVAGKIRNSRSVVMRGVREAESEEESARLRRCGDDLAASLRATKGAATLDELRGIEGEVARRYFAALNLVLKPSVRGHFGIESRTKRPPRDRLNALLSFLYSLLMNDCRSALESVGLDPQIGFLHAVRPGRASLALDLQEEFRAVLADRFALTLVNRGQLGEDDFEVREGGAVMLGDQARRMVVAAWQERKRETVTHPLAEEAMPVGLLPFIQSRFIARTLRGDMDTYVPFFLK